MSVEKFSVSFDPDLGRQIREMAEAQDQTVSAFLAEAARERLRQLILGQFIADEAKRMGTTPDALADEGERLLAQAVRTSQPRRRRTAAGAA